MLAGLEGIRGKRLGSEYADWRFGGVLQITFGNIKCLNKFNLFIIVIVKMMNKINKF